MGKTKEIIKRNYFAHYVNVAGLSANEAKLLLSQTIKEQELTKKDDEVVIIVPVKDDVWDSKSPKLYIGETSSDEINSFNFYIDTRGMTGDRLKSNLESLKEHFTALFNENDIISFIPSNRTLIEKL